MGGEYDPVCSYQPGGYDPDPCVTDPYLNGYYQFVKDACGCYCIPGEYGAQGAIENQLLNGNNVENNAPNGEEFTQLQFLMLNAVVSAGSVMLIIGACLAVYCLYFKCSKTTKKYEFVEEDNV